MPAQITGVTLLQQDAHLFAAARASRPSFTREEFEGWVSRARHRNMYATRWVNGILMSMMPELSPVIEAKQDEVVRG